MIDFYKGVKGSGTSANYENRAVYSCPIFGKFCLLQTEETCDVSFSTETLNGLEQTSETVRCTK